LHFEPTFKHFQFQLQPHYCTVRQASAYAVSLRTALCCDSGTSCW